MARISVNKLAELLITSNATRRRRIVHEQKYPKDTVVALYRHAKKPIEKYFRNGRDPEILLEAAEKLREDRSGTSWAIDDRWNTADALEHFSEIAEGLPSEHGEVYRLGDAQPPKLLIAGVDVSIRPDFLIHFEKRGVAHTGALKLHFVKNADSALTRAGSEYVSTMLHQWLEAHGPEGKASHAHCICVDVFRRSTFLAPKSNARRLEDIQSMCEEIAARWPQL